MCIFLIHLQEFCLKNVLTEISFFTLNMPLVTTHKLRGQDRAYQK